MTFALAAALAGPAWGQAEFSVPENLTLFGQSDPSVRKATALVNGDVVTETDVEQRLALVVAANGGRIGPEERERLRVQILRNLIDEKLQIQEAQDKEITVPDSDVEETFIRVARNFKMTPEQFDVYLRERGASPETLKQQVRAELAWSRLLRRRVEPFVAVGDDEVEAVIKRLEESKGKDEFRVGEIFLSAAAETEAERMAVARNIVQQVRSGASFVAYARQFSESASAAVGGDLGWIRPEQMDDAVRPAIEALSPGMVSDPIRVPGGVRIVALIEKRQILTADPLDATLSLKQITMPLAGGASEVQARAAGQKLAAATRNMGGCGRADEVARSIGAEVANNDQLRMRDLPAPLQQILKDLRVGEATPPFGAPEEGVRILVLCGRDESTMQAKMPSFDELQAQMNEQRVSMMARRYLRDLRRDAVVDYR